MIRGLYMKKTNKKLKIVYNIFLILLGMFVLDNIIFGQDNFKVVIITLGIGIYVFVKLIQNAKNKSSDDENEAEKW